MRKLKMLAVLAIAVASCTTEPNQSQQQTPTLDAMTRSSILTELETNLTEEMGIPIKYESSEVIQIDNTYYLRARSDAYVTTTMLRVTELGELVGLGVSCTSSSCARSTTGCVPKWVDGTIPTCTKCTEGTKDCKRTFTSG